ncbi:hypothetical protein DB347_07050 [Opitutaceae bacterium EW11]|nr:hypothetical protein DB347_07050 [Opitutaceae bacterium EW11]
MNAFTVGTIIARTKAGVAEHVGVVTAPNLVLHNTPTRGEHESSLAEFAAGSPVTIKGRVRDMISFMHRVWRKRQNLRPYDLVSNNCEHTISALTDEQPSSPQLQAWGFVFLVIIGIVTLTRVGTK